MSMIHRKIPYHDYINSLQINLYIHCTFNKKIKSRVEKLQNEFMDFWSVSKEC